MLSLAAVAMLAGCRQEMYDQPRFEPYEATALFDNGTSSRPLPEGVVARLDPRDEPRDDFYHTGRLADGKHGDHFPFRVTREDMVRGQQRYMIFCSPCHGALGDGRGMIVERGFSPPPPFYGRREAKAPEGSPVSLYADLREAPAGHFFDVITNGHGAMYSYASRIPPDDRWRIAAYIRVLQLSQHATLDDLKGIEQPTADERRLLGEAGR